MNDRMTESEEKVVRSVLKTELFCAGQLRAQAGCATLSPYVVCLNREERQYGIAFNGKVVKEYYIPETYFQVMDDIENGRILQSQTDPSLRMKYTNSCEAYKGDTTVNPYSMEGSNKTEMQRESINKRYRTFDDFLRDLKDDYKMGITIFLYSHPDLRKRARATKPCDYFKLYNEIKKLYFEMIESKRYKEFLRKHTQHA